MFEQNGKDHASIMTAMEDGFKNLADKIDLISDNKANKWVEILLVWLGGAIGLGLITWLGTLVYKATIQLQ